MSCNRPGVWTEEGGGDHGVMVAGGGKDPGNLIQNLGAEVDREGGEREPDPADRVGWACLGEVGRGEDVSPCHHCNKQHH